MYSLLNHSDLPIFDSCHQFCRPDKHNSLIFSGFLDCRNCALSMWLWCYFEITDIGHGYHMQACNWNAFANFYPTHDYSIGLILNKERHIFVLILVEQNKTPLETTVLLCPSVWNHILVLLQSAPLWPEMTISGCNVQQKALRTGCSFLPCPNIMYWLTNYVTTELVLEQGADVRLEKTDQVSLSFSVSECVLCVLVKSLKRNVGIEESMLNYSLHSSNSRMLSRIELGINFL